MKLFFLNGARSGETFSLTPPCVTIGREPDNTLSVSDGGLSRYHAKIEWDETAQTWSITDLNSTNGTKINELKIQNIAAELVPGDLIALGSQLIKVLGDPISAQPILNFPFDKKGE